MEKTLLVILVKHRSESATKLQSILTEYGCMIKTRLGIHDGVLDQCSNSGLIILELVGDAEKKQEIEKKLKDLDGIASKFVSLSI
jgi:hypothetical protein